MVQGNVAAEARLRWLTATLGESGSVTISDAAAALGVSEMTIRRDLTELEDRGAARRVRGGALPLGPHTFAERHQRRTRAKAQIATKLAALLPTAGIVAFDASSTVMRLTAALTTARDLTIVTNGPETFAALEGQPGVTGILTGGQLDPRTGSLVGPIACRSAVQLTARCFIASAAGVDVEHGATEATLEEAEVKRVLATSADEVILAVDSSKLEKPAGAVSLEWVNVDVLVTELDPKDKRLRALRRLVRVI